MSSTPSVIVIGGTQGYQAPNSTHSPKHHCPVNSGSDEFEGPRSGHHKKEKEHPIISFFVKAGAVATAAVIAAGAITAWRSPKFAANMLRQGHWNDVTHSNVKAKCEEFTKSNEKFEAQVSKWSLPKSVKAAIFSWRGKFYEAMGKEFPESTHALKDRALTDSRTREEIQHNDALRRYVTHKQEIYNNSAERLRRGSASEVPAEKATQRTASLNDAIQQTAPAEAEVRTPAGDARVDSAGSPITKEIPEGYTDVTKPETKKTKSASGSKESEFNLDDDADFAKAPHNSNSKKQK